MRKRLRRAWVFVASAALAGLLVLLPVPCLLDAVIEGAGPYEARVLWGLLVYLACVLLLGPVHVVIEAVRGALRPAARSGAPEPPEGPRRLSEEAHEDFRRLRTGPV